MRDRLKRFEGEFGPIKIIVVSKKEINSEADWTEEFEVMPLDKISTLMAKLAAKRPLPRFAFVNSQSFNLSIIRAVLTCRFLMEL